MSAFLGPIHTWLYGKILFQNELTEELIRTAKEEKWFDGSVHTERYGVLEQGELAQLIDEKNIHGWLQERVNLVENRLAYVVTVAMQDDVERIKKLEETAFEVGQKYAIQNHLENLTTGMFALQGTYEQLEDVDAFAAYQYLENLLLNGMPCDRVNEMVSSSDKRIVWRQVNDIHGVYWNQIHGDDKNYYRIRNSLIQGIFAHTDIRFAEIEDKVYEITI